MLTEADIAEMVCPRPEEVLYSSDGDSGEELDDTLQSAESVARDSEDYEPSQKRRIIESIETRELRKAARQTKKKEVQRKLWNYYECTWYAASVSTIGKISASSTLLDVN